jgi:hypothetical protein
LYINNTIDYIIPLSQQSKFYVDEYHDDDAGDDYYRIRKLNNSTNTNNLKSSYPLKID